MLRNASSKIGESNPIVSNDGRQPIKNAAAVIKRIDVESDHLRPFLSPMLPQNAAPSGRNMNESANTANAINVESTADSGQNTTPIVMAK